jgi:hypothetical protein
MYSSVPISDLMILINSNNVFVFFVYVQRVVDLCNLEQLLLGAFVRGGDGVEGCWMFEQVLLCL